MFVVVLVELMVVRLQVSKRVLLLDIILSPAVGQSFIRTIVSFEFQFGPTDMLSFQTVFMDDVKNIQKNPIVIIFF